MPESVKSVNKWDSRSPCRLHIRSRVPHIRSGCNVPPLHKLRYCVAGWECGGGAGKGVGGVLGSAGGLGVGGVAKPQGVLVMRSGKSFLTLPMALSDSGEKWRGGLGCPLLLWFL